MDKNNNNNKIGICIHRSITIPIPFICLIFREVDEKY